VRPKPCRVATHSELQQMVAGKLMQDWSPQQVSGCLKMEYPNDESPRVSHVTIYRSLFILGRRALKQELVRRLRSKRRVRRSRRASVYGHSQGRIVNALSIRERPAEVEDRAVPGHWEVDPLRGAGNTHVVTLVRKQKTDDRDALHILDLLMQNRFPRIWVPSAAERDVRQLVRHRHKLVRLRTSVMNQLHALAMGFACRAARQVSW